MPKIAIIGGTGVSNKDNFTLESTLYPDTPYGKPSDEIQIGKFCGVDVAFLHRHGGKNQFNPTNVPYRANIWALKKMGVEMILSMCAVGSLKEQLAPGDMVILDDFIDFTRHRDLTFVDDAAVHISLPDPFCPHMRSVFADTAKEFGLKHHVGGTYVCIEGPRFSTKAESNLFRNFADVIGMTLVPECQLAKELGMCYCSIATITDYDMWKDEHVDTGMVKNVMAENSKSLQALLKAGLPKIHGDQCDCGEDARVAGSANFIV